MRFAKVSFFINAFFILILRVSIFSLVEEQEKEIVKGIEITLRKPLQFHIKKSSFSGIYLSVFFNKDYIPSCFSKGIYSDKRYYCVFTFTKYELPEKLKNKVINYLKKQKINIKKINQIHLKVFYQSQGDIIKDEKNQIKLPSFLLELWSEYNYFFKEKNVKTSGYPEKNLTQKLKNTWIIASAGFAYYHINYPQKGKRVIGSLETKTSFSLYSQLKHQFLLIKILKK